MKMVMHRHHYFVLATSLLLIPVVQLSGTLVPALVVQFLCSSSASSSTAGTVLVLVPVYWD
jgi:hypothetical protein